MCLRSRPLEARRADVRSTQIEKDPSKTLRNSLSLLANMVNPPPEKKAKTESNNDTNKDNKDDDKKSTDHISAMWKNGSAPIVPGKL